MNAEKSMLLLINPQAGKGKIKRDLLPVLEVFNKAGFSVNVYTSHAAGDITQCARNNANRYDYLVCSGGDGTMNEMLNGIMLSGCKPVLGYIPAGTVNDFASSFELPKHPLKAAEAIAYGDPVFFDVGKFENKYFTYSAAFGAFTEVSYQTPQDLKSVVGKLAYLLEAATRVTSIHTNKVIIEHDNGVIEDNILVGVITNSKYVAGISLGKMTQTYMDDGLTEVFLLKGTRNIKDVAPLVNAFLLGNASSDQLILLKTKKLRIKAETPLDWTLDGEYGGTFQCVNIDNLRCALRIMVPGENKA